MIEGMATVRITEAELVRDIHAVLAQVQEGVEVIVERRHRPVAVIKTPQGPGRKIAECIALALGYAPAPDADFAKDVQAAIDAHREPYRAGVTGENDAAAGSRWSTVRRESAARRFKPFIPSFVPALLGAGMQRAWHTPSSSRG